MSAAAAPAPELRIAPPAPAQPAPRPAAPSAEHGRRMARARAFAAAMCVAGALLPVPCAAAEPYLGAWVWVGIGFSWGFLLPVGGLALLIVALNSRARADLRAMLLAAATFAADIPLLPLASRVGLEAYVSSHSAELEALAARSRTEWIAGPPRDGPYPESNRAFQRELRAHGFEGPWFADGGLVFVSTQIFGPSVLYADGGRSGGESRCRDLRSIGGRWYTADCELPHG
jgi:hypothetical protein